MLTILQFIFLCYKLQLCFICHVHYTLFICHANEIENGGNMFGVGISFDKSFCALVIR
jgi:hypothetical protein